MILACLAIVLAQATPAPAPTPAAAAPAVDPARLAAARRVVEAGDVRGTMRAIGPRIVDAAIASTRAMFRDDAIPDGLMRRLQDVMRDQAPTLTDVYTPAVLDRMAGIYVRHFSTAELDRLAVLLADPAMVRFRSEMPAAMGDLMPVILAAMAPRQEAFRKAMVEAVADWLRDHPRDKTRLVTPFAA